MVDNDFPRYTLVGTGQPARTLEETLSDPPKFIEAVGPLSSQKLNPVIVSTASPSPVELLQARSNVQNDPGLQALFRQFKAEGWPKERLVDFVTTKLHSVWPEGDPSEASQFLVDEYDQLGEGIHLVSTETGRVAVVLSEDDIYDPPPVPREDGSMAQPLARIRPEIESAIVTWSHDQGREAQILKTLAERGHQTALLREMGDPRLLVATRRGRQHIVNSFGRLDPRTLLEAAGGTSAAFLRCFTLVEAAPEDASGVYLTGKVEARSRMGVQDPTTINLHHNRPAVMAAALVQGWVREIAKVVSGAASSRLVAETLSLDRATRLPSGLWVAPPDFVRPFRRINPNITVLPVEGAAPITIEGKIGYLKVPPEFKAKNFEAFDRWEALTLLDFEMWLDLKAIKAYMVLGFEPQVQVL